MSLFLRPSGAGEPMTFIDRVELELIAGKGGDGCVSFRRERFIPRGGPDGGDGGDGGSIILEARQGVNNLVALAARRVWKAQRGRHGEGSNRHGKSGRDLVLYVPPGTVVRDAEHGYVIKDLVAPGDRVVAARGGKGGRGNASFKSPTNRAPREFTRGQEGEVRRVVLELKTIADVGLIGLPNAGKSTLLSRLTRARPRIASYPFTTLHPHLGRVVIDWERSFVIADIPGLIEGAHRGAGLGHEFLRHVERARVLVHLVEPAPLDGSDPVRNYHAIRNELVRYQEALAHRPEVVVVSKYELPGAEQVRERLAESLGKEVLGISAVTGHGLKDLVNRLLQLLQAVAQEPETQGAGEPLGATRTEQA